MYLIFHVGFKRRVVDVMHIGSLTLWYRNIRSVSWVPNNSSTKGYCTRSCHCVLYKVEEIHQWGKLLFCLIRWTYFICIICFKSPISHKSDDILCVEWTCYCILNWCAIISRRENCPPVGYEWDINALQHNCFSCSLFPKIISSIKCLKLYMAYKS
jgi:hypothetical protein